jgi:predicted nucleic acid-binding protein
MSADKPDIQAHFSPERVRFERLLAMAEAGEETVIAQAGKPVSKLLPRLSVGLRRTFLDTNILFYAEDRSEPTKQRKALDIIKSHLEQRTGVVSLQVLQEYFSTVTKKLRLDAGMLRNKIEIYSKFSVAEAGLSDIFAAIDMHRLHGFSFWDAMILRMAKQSGCRVLLSEDLQAGRFFEGIEIVNPFL